MDTRDRTKRTTNLLFGLMGTVCLFAIIAVKLMRFRGYLPASLAIDVAPSILGPSGLLFLLLSSTGRLSRLGLLQVTLLVAVLSIGLEFAQLIPRPGILAHISYAFDYFDLAATVLSLAAAYVISLAIARRQPAGTSRR